MAEVKVEESVEAPASAVWELASDFGGVDKWAGPAILGCSVEGEGVGAVRTLSLPGDANFQEKLESFDEQARTLSYSIVDPSPLPLCGYLSTLRVVEDGPKRCRVWRAGFPTHAGSGSCATREA